MSGTLRLDRLDSASWGVNLGSAVPALYALSTSCTLSSLRLDFTSCDFLFERLLSTSGILNLVRIDTSSKEFHFENPPSHVKVQCDSRVELEES